MTPTAIECSYCKKAFIAQDRRRMYCSSACNSRAQHKRLRDADPLPTQKCCDHCGVLFIPKKKRQRFCCMGCKTTWGNANRKITVAICAGCGVAFEATQRKTKYCSTGCAVKHTVPVKECVCVDCGVSFSFKGRTRRQHCVACTPAWVSRSQMQWRAKRDATIKIGVGSGGAQFRESNHQWNPAGAYHDVLRLQGYKSGYTRVCFLNWDKQCAVDVTHVGVVDVHHINGVRGDNSIPNLIPLCRACHSQIHHKRKYRTEEEYVEATMALLPEKCRNKIAELSGKAERLIRTEGCLQGSQGQSIVGEINHHEAATPELVG